MKTSQLSILGAEYTLIQDASEETYPYLQGCDGYCDYYDKKIVLGCFTEENGYEHGDLEHLKRKVLRHEIIHALLYESGLSHIAEDEQIVDWLAIQFPKMNRIFEELEIEA